MKVDKPRWKGTINLLDFYKVQKGCIQEQWTQFQRDLGVSLSIYSKATEYTIIIIIQLHIIIIIIIINIFFIDS